MKIPGITVIACLLIVLFASCDQEQVENYDFIYDPCPDGPGGESGSIEIGLRNALKKEVCAKITRAELASITHLDASVRGFGWIDDQDAEVLQYCINLQVLNLSDYDGRMSHIRPLEGLVHLIDLNLFGHNIFDLHPLVGSQNLQRLNLYANNVSDISTLQVFGQLKELNLAKNRIVDLKPLVDNRGFSQGATVDVSGNPLSGISKNQHIPALEARGVIVKW
ncbi:leucine-rich repeat domain-containing protein [Candidatus Poribacteria bacterium]|nr:leucine-rich repeat domain-containing protein [Candidatus Poribacteria bacterium]